MKMLLSTLLLTFLISPTVKAESSRQSIQIQLQDLNDQMKENCIDWNFACQNKFLVEVVKLHELEAKLMFREYVAIRGEVRYKKNLTQKEHDKIISDFESIAKFNKFLTARSEQVTKEFRSAQESIFAKTDLGQYAGSARINNVLKNQIEVLKRYKKELADSTKYLENISK